MVALDYRFALSSSASLNAPARNLSPVGALQDGVKMGTTSRGRYVWPMAETYLALGRQTAALFLPTILIAGVGAVSQASGKKHHFALAARTVLSSPAVPVSLAFPSTSS